MKRVGELIVVEMARVIVAGSDESVTLRYLHERLVDVELLEDTRADLEKLRSGVAEAQRVGNFPTLAPPFGGQAAA